MTILLLCALFVGCASALTGFTESKTTAVISPDGVLQVGDKVTATVTLYFPQDYPRSTESLKLISPLNGVSWVLTPSDGTHDLTYTTRQGKSAEIPSFFINYDYPFQVRVDFSGSVPSSLVGMDINALTIQHCSGSSVISSYVSPVQYVYNVANFPADVNARKSALSQVQTSINSYAGTGINTAEAQSIASKANENILTAENLGVDSLTSALASLDAADINIAAAKESLNYAILNYVAGQINVLNSDVNTLNALGASDKATMVSVSANSLVMMYNTAVKAFETDKTGDYTSLYNSAESMLDIADNYIAQARAASPSATSTPQPTKTAVVTPTQTASNPSYTTNPTAVQTQVPGNKITFTLDGTTMILLIVIVVLIAGLIITFLLYRGAKSSGGRDKKQKKEKKGRDNDKWESL
ncbi:MAG TPA: hypothetical protein O0X39_07440 [Methanocorpusculum sp.]|nr:hypothetical protein [Methanocorpusculum sp.]